MAGARSPAEGFRPDLEGLRGVAILLVLLFHADLPFVSGGFIGVDVFFVLSGFLITGLLLRERERSGRIGLAGFYARRARRILPAQAVVIVATLAASAVLLAPLDLERVAGDAVATALFAGNLRFAANAMDYFGAVATPSPLLHYWSLGVEEQFYLLWPTLLLVATRWSRPRLGAGLAIGAVIVASFALDVVLTDRAAAWAFYSLPTRAWQLGLGGLLAITATWHARLPDRVAAALGWLGLAAILVGVAVIDAMTPYPGVAALLPTLGSAGVILAGDRPGSPGLILVTRPLRFLGRISYSLYLVHWPMLILPAASLPIGQELPLAVRLGLAAAAIPVGWLSFRFVEQPIHRGTRFALPARRTLALAGTAIATTVAISLGVGVGAARIVDAASAGGVAFEPAGAAPSPAPGGSPVPGGSAAASSAGSPSSPAGASPTPSGPASAGASAVASSSPSPIGSSSPSPAGSAAASPPAAPPSPSPSPPPTPRPLPTPPPRPTPPPPGPQPLPAGVRPSLRDARSDTEAIARDGCTLLDSGTEPPDCVFGDRNGSITVALVGDSHAAQWFPALDRLAHEHGWRLVTFTKVSCRFTDLRIYSRELKREYTECEQWRLRVVARLKALKPDLTIVSSAEGMKPMVSADASPARQGAGTARLLAGVPGRVAVLVDTPWSQYDVPSCLSAHVRDERACATPRRAALGWQYRILEVTAARALGSRATVVDLTDWICPGDPCPAVVDGMIVYRDVFHLTATFATSLAPALDAQLEPILHPTPPKPSPTPTQTPPPPAVDRPWPIGRMVPV